MLWVSLALLVEVAVLLMLVVNYYKKWQQEKLIRRQWQEKCYDLEDKVPSRDKKGRFIKRK
jgi:hypothetical protein